MKALIVDDEKHVRDAIRYFIPWEEHEIETVLEATNGQEAIELIRRENPAIIFTDMKMPLVGGVELMAWIHKFAPRAKTIVISGYHDFEYVQPTIVYGGMDYLLKPLKSKPLIEAAERAVRAWKLEEEERRRGLDRELEVNTMRPLYRDKLMSDWVSGRLAYRDLADRLQQEFGLPKALKRISCAVIPLVPLEPTLAARFKDDAQLVAFAVLNICNEVLNDARLGCAFHYWGTGTDIGIVLWEDATEAGLTLAKIGDAAERLFGGHLDIGLGTSSPFPDGAVQSFEQASQALRLRQADKRVLSGIYAFMENKDSRLVHDIRAYLETNYHREITLQDIAERFFVSRENVSRKFKQVTDENLIDYLTRLRIEKAKQLLADPTIRLSRIAEMVGIQDEKYFSRVFKKLTGSSPREFRKRS